MTEQYFIIIPDLPGAPRLEVRPKHLARAATMDSILIGGAFLGSQPDSDDSTKWDFKGSAMVQEFPEGTGVEGVRAVLKEDPYVTDGVWDLESARIIPFKTGFAKAK